MMLRNSPPASEQAEDDLAEQIELQEKLAWLDQVLPQANLTEPERARVRAAEIYRWKARKNKELPSARAVRRILEDPDVRRYLDHTIARLPIRSWTRFIEARRAPPSRPPPPPARGLSPASR